MFAVGVGLVGYAVFDNRQVDFWPPKIHPRPPGDTVSGQAETPDPAPLQAKIQELESKVQKYESFLNYLSGLDASDIAINVILDEFGGPSGMMNGYELEREMQERDLRAGLGGRLTGMRHSRIIEGDLNTQVTLTDFGRRLVRIRRAFQKALEALQAKDRRNKPSI